MANVLMEHVTDRKNKRQVVAHVDERGVKTAIISSQILQGRKTGGQLSACMNSKHHAGVQRIKNVV